MKLPLVLSSFLAMFSFSSAATLKIGDPAPIVSGTTEAGVVLNFADTYKTSPYTLVFFYPKAFTPGCTAQSCSLRDGYEQLATLGVTIIGVSTDSVETQKKFKDEYRLPYTLIADTDKAVLKAFGQSALLFANRQAYLINDVKIVYADTKGSTKQQSDDILKFLSAK